MILPYRPKLLPTAERKLRAIIIHDTSCMFEDYVEFMVDTAKYQTGKMKTMSFVMHGEYELNYHFVVEKIDQDYAALIGRPLFAKCEYEDIPDMYRNAIHVCVMGDFTNENPGERVYQTIAYKVIIPLMRTYRITPARVMLHRDVSTDKNSDCPGIKFKKNLLDSYIKSWKVTK